MQDKPDTDAIINSLMYDSGVDKRSSVLSQPVLFNRSELHRQSRAESNQTDHLSSIIPGQVNLEETFEPESVQNGKKPGKFRRMLKWMDKKMCGGSSGA